MTKKIPLTRLEERGIYLLIVLLPESLCTPTSQVYMILLNIVNYGVKQSDGYKSVEVTDGWHCSLLLALIDSLVSIYQRASDTCTTC
jgi:hypothetical protein